MSDGESLRPRLRAGLAALDLELDDTAQDRLLAYVDLLRHWNAAYNLTAVRDPAEMVTRHLLDSLAILRFVRGTTLADLGSGAGLPGIPLAIAEPSRAILLVDSNGKKARFLREAVRKLDLSHARVEERRVEAVEGAFECITARAFASLGDMLSWGGHLLTADGIWLAMKGRFPQDELDAVPPAFRVDELATLNVPGLDADRHLVVIKRSSARDDGHFPDSARRGG